jgi:hypothetical protein
VLSLRAAPVSSGSDVDAEGTLFPRVPSPLLLAARPPQAGSGGRGVQRVEDSDGQLLAATGCLLAGPAIAATPPAGRPYSVSVQADHTLNAIGPSPLGVNTPLRAASLLTAPGTRPGPLGRHKGSGLQRRANGRPVPMENKPGGPAGRAVRVPTLGPPLQISTSGRPSPVRNMTRRQGN